MNQVNLNRHDLRVTAKFPIQTHVTPFGAGRWAQAIIDRYLGRFWTRLALNTQWRIAQRGQAASSIYQQTQVFAPTQLTLAPRIQLTLLTHRMDEWSTPGLMPASSSDAPPSGWHVSRPPISAAHVQLLWQRLRAREQLESTVTQQLTQALVTRHQRVETLETVPNGAVRSPMVGMLQPTAANQGEPWRQASAPPVPRIVHKTVAAPPNPATADATTPATWQQPSALAARQMTMHTQPVNGNHLDINRLTDQVMQQIDRRLLAHRERTGRA